MRERSAGHAGGAVAPALLVAAMTGIALQCVRVLFPLLYDLYERGGVGPAAGLAAAVFASPVLAIALSRRGGRAAVGVAVAGRLAIQMVQPAPTWLVAAAAGAALIGWAVALDRTPGGAAVGVTLGVTLDAAVLTAFQTLDPVWRDGTAALAAAVAWAAVAGAIGLWAAREASLQEEPETRSARPWALGPYALLSVLFLANPAFVASATGLGPAAAGAVTLGGGAVAVVTASITPGRRRIEWIAAVVVTAGAATLPAAAGVGLVPLLLVMQGACGLTMGLAAGTSLHRDRSTGLDSGRSAGLAAGTSLAPALRQGPIMFATGMLVFATIAFAYQLDVEQPLPFPRWLLPGAGGALLGLAAIRAGTTQWIPARVHDRVRTLIVLPIAAAVSIPVILGATAPAPRTRAGHAAVRILDWNVHGSVDADGRVDPAQVASVIAAEDPDLVILQEVARGWPIHGQVDLAAWLSSSLGMPYRWAPAADGQFGNLVLSRLPILGSEAVVLPYLGGPQQRSYLRVTLEVGEGRSLTVIGAHLQQRNGSDVGIEQATQLVTAWDGEDATVVAGDLNAQPDDPTAAVLTDAGLVSAQDAAGDPTESTAREPTASVDRVDWILFSPDLRIDSFDIVASGASDHLPLIAVVRLGAGA